jgi:hypothetical protein
MKNSKLILIIGMLISLAFLPMINANAHGDTPGNNPLLYYDYSNDQELLITFQLSEVIQEEILTPAGLFTKLEVPTLGFIGDIGSPQLPALTRMYAVPTHDLSLTIIAADPRETREVGRIIPVQNPQTDSGIDGASEFTYDEDAYQQDVTYPDPLVEIVGVGNIRDIPFVTIRFYPIQYNPARQIATFYDKIQIKLICSPQPPLLVESDYKQKPFYEYYETMFQNWQGFTKHTIFEQPSSMKNTGCDYLVITHQNFYDQAQQLADWKHMTGLMAKTVNVSEIGSTANQIRQYIQTAYDTWDPRPSFVLLMGDEEFIPTNRLYTHPYSGGLTPSDHWYTTVDGSDYYADIFIGRIPADTVAEAEVMVQKILDYEQNPPTLPSFYEDFVVAAYFQDDEHNGYESRRFVRTSEEVRDYLTSIGYSGERIYCTESNINPTHYNNGYYGNGEPLPPELLRPTFPWNGNANDIITAVNQGIFILNHRDHGMVSGWGDPYFTTSHLSSLTNGDLLPVVFSLNCLTGKFTPGECFAEEFIRKPDGGAVAVFAASEVSYSGYNDYLCRGMYDALWPDFDTTIGDDVPLYHLGQILNYGKTYMANTWGNAWGYERLTFELFHVFGDPSLSIYTALPCSLEVTTSCGSNSIQVTVQSNGNPVKGARVCISQESGFYQAGLTNTDGVAQLDNTGVILTENISLFVTAHNHLYYNENFILNQPPEKPSQPTGPNSGKSGTTYLYQTSTTDSDGEQVYYLWDWGDGDYSDWLGPYDSGESVSTSHVWSEDGTYLIRVKAKDVNDAESSWSDPLAVTMPYSYTHPILQFIQVLFMRFPHAFPFLRQLLGY